MKCNILFGLPSSPNDDAKVLDSFLSLEGLHVVCGGTTAQVVAKKLGKPLKVSLHYEDKDVPPIGYIEGIDLVTEGVITMSRVLEYTLEYIRENLKENELGNKACNEVFDISKVPNSGAAKVANLLIDKASSIYFFVGSSNEKRCEIVDELCVYLKRIGKEVVVTKF